MRINLFILMHVIEISYIPNKHHNIHVKAFPLIWWWKKKLFFFQFSLYSTKDCKSQVWRKLMTFKEYDNKSDSVNSHEHEKRDDLFFKYYNFLLFWNKNFFFVTLDLKVFKAPREDEKYEENSFWQTSENFIP